MIIEEETKRLNDLKELNKWDLAPNLVQCCHQIYVCSRHLPENIELVGVLRNVLRYISNNPHVQVDLVAKSPLSPFASAPQSRT